MSFILSAQRFGAAFSNASVSSDVCRLEEEVFFQPAHISATNIEWLLTEAVLIQFVSPDDEHDVLEICTEL